MRTKQVYVEDPWDVASYMTKLKTLYRAMHGLKRTSPVDDAKVRQYSEWLVPKVDKLYAYMRSKYTNLSVLSSMMLPVVSVLRQELGQDHPITAKWREEATDLRFQMDEETSHNEQDDDFKTYEEICHRRDSIKEHLGKDPTQHTIQYWQWFALCLYTMQPPLRADWASFSIRETIEDASPNGNYLILTREKALILIREDKVSKRKGGAQIAVTSDLHAVLLESLSRFPRSVVVPYTYKASRKALYLSYTPDKHITKVNLSKLLAQAMASLQDNTPWTRPIQRLRKAHSTYVMSSNASYHTMKEVAAAQRHSVPTMLCFYNTVHQPSLSQDDSSTSDNSAIEERIETVMQQSRMCHQKVIIMTLDESQGEGTAAWSIHCSAHELQACAEEGLAKIRDRYSPKGGP